MILVGTTSTDSVVMGVVFRRHQYSYIRYNNFSMPISHPFIKALSGSTLLTILLKNKTALAIPSLVSTIAIKANPFRPIPRRSDRDMAQ